MKILSIAEFDPCAVLAGHKTALCARGVDYRLAIHDIYSAHVTSARADWLLADPKCDLASLIAFATHADIVQFHPAIGQPWSYASLDPRLGGDAHEQPFGSIHWPALSHNMRGRRVAYFHGSRNAAANAAKYAHHYRAQGMAIWASTLDYVAWMGATYAPPVVEILGAPAPLRKDDDPLIVAHTPTDPANCHTTEFMEAVKLTGVVPRFATRKAHVEVLALKRECHAGFDHMRGAFSVNTLEHAALGLVPIVGLTRDFAKLSAFADFGRVPFHTPQNRDELVTVLRWLDDTPLVTRRYQIDARRWVGEHFSSAAIGLRLETAYRSLST